MVVIGDDEVKGGGRPSSQGVSHSGFTFSIGIVRGLVVGRYVGGLWLRKASSTSIAHLTAARHDRTTIQILAKSHVTLGISTPPLWHHRYRAYALPSSSMKMGRSYNYVGASRIPSQIGSLPTRAARSPYRNWTPLSHKLGPK